MMKDKNRYMFCSDCGYAFKEDKIFKKAYTNTAICLCRECALKLALEITDKYVDIRETQKAPRQAEAETGEVVLCGEQHHQGWRRGKRKDVGKNRGGIKRKDNHGTKKANCRAKRTNRKER